MGRTYECRYCGESVELAEDGAWQGVEDHACGCTLSLEQGGVGEHEVLIPEMSSCDRTDGGLDRAVIAYRREPTPENEARLMDMMRAHADSFMREQTGEFIRRTR